MFSLYISDKERDFLHRLPRRPRFSREAWVLLCLSSRTHICVRYVVRLLLGVLTFGNGFLPSFVRKPWGLFNPLCVCRMFEGMVASWFGRLGCSTLLWRSFCVYLCFRALFVIFWPFSFPLHTSVQSLVCFCFVVLCLFSAVRLQDFGLRCCTIFGYGGYPVRFVYISQSHWALPLYQKKKIWM